MKKRFLTLLLVVIYCLTGCADTKHIEEQRSDLEETINVTEMGEEITPKEETEPEDVSIQEQETPSVEESINPSENAEEEVTAESSVVYKTIPVEEIVYEENDVVFVITKRSVEGGASDYGYLISAGGKVVPFQVLHDDFFTLEMGADYGNIVDMKTIEPLMEFESNLINQYIEKMKSIDMNSEKKTTFHGYEYEYERIFIYGRKVDCDKNVEYIEIYSYADPISEPTDPNAIELMNWLLELNETLTEETKEE